MSNNFSALFLVDELFSLIVFPKNIDENLNGPRLIKSIERQPKGSLDYHGANECFPKVMSYFVQNPFDWYPKEGKTANPMNDHYAFKWMTLGDATELAANNKKLSKSLSSMSAAEAKMKKNGWK